jgi:UDP-N-acetylglucosamine 1-carboxyvinyltransferase
MHFLAKMEEMGVQLQIGEDSIFVPHSTELQAINIKTLPFPGFATDLQQPITPLLSRASGVSVIVDTIYPQRTKHVKELQNMGMNISAEGGLIMVERTREMHGARVSAGEIRAGASLMIAGLMAQGETVITKADNILRGYDRIVWKLNRLNANVRIEDESGVEVIE